MRFNIIQIVLFVAVLTCHISSLSAKNTLVLSAVERTVPAKVVGEVLRQAYKYIGIQVEIKELPGKRALILSQQGVMDGEAYRIQGIEKDYPTLLRIDVPVSVDQMYLFVKRGKIIAVEGWETIPEDAVIGYQRGIQFVEKFTAKYRIATIPANSSEQLFRMLESDRVDAVVAGSKNGLRIIKELGVKDVVRLEPPIYTSVLYHYLHKKHAHLVPKITKVLKKMAASGEIQKIQEQINVD